jgi:uncharacterized membrane protein
MNSSKIKSYFLSNKFILTLILLVATILRFYNLFSIPFTHDEFSALFRTNFDSFSALIEHGVKVDGHPAGVQIFLYYWTKVFGQSEWVVKIPFLLCGIASVYLIYKIGKLWFNDTVGLIAAAYLASLQFAIIYSQIARPYGSGLFLSLLMVYFWSRFILNQEKNVTLNLIAFAFSASLCTYNHYFSFLFAIIVGFSGFFFIKKNMIFKYLLAGFLIAILYIPHINILFAQLKMKGVEGWLAKPTLNFFISYPSYIFHFSIFVSLTLFLLIIAGLIQKGRSKYQPARSIMFILWFLLPIIIGYLYSIYINSVLQYSVLIFSFPFLFLFLFSHIKQQGFIINISAVFIVLTVNTISLITEREHYKVFYTSAYKNILTDYLEYKSDNDIIAYIDSNQKITSYYLSQLENYPEFIDVKDLNNRKCFIENIQKASLNYDYLYFGCLSDNDPISVPVIMDYYPQLIKQNNYFAGNSYLFGKTKPQNVSYFSQLNFENNSQEYWTTISPENIKFDSSNTSKYYQMTEYVEWSPTLIVPLNNIDYSKTDFIDLSVKVLHNIELNDVHLVASIESEGKSIYYTASTFNDFCSNFTQDKWTSIHLSLKLSDIQLNYPDMILKVYIWNQSKKTFKIDDFGIKIRTGNPIVYNLTQ